MVNNAPESRVINEMHAARRGIVHNSAERLVAEEKHTLDDGRQD
jgi:hypothetical protein